eukprot:scaffold9484_cov124-Isochrysis_galbana.AAC.24
MVCDMIRSSPGAQAPASSAGGAPVPPPRNGHVACVTMQLASTVLASGLGRERALASLLPSPIPSSRPA